LNQVIAPSEAAIVQLIKSGVSVRFALSPNVARVAVELEALRSIVVGLCAEACSGLLPGGHLVIETRGLNDALVPPATKPASSAQACARLIVRAEQTTGTVASLAPKAEAQSEGELGIAELQLALDRIGGRLELVPLPENGLAYVAHLPYVTSPTSSGRMPVAIAQGVAVILLVEDEPQVQAVTARILRAFGYAVITAHNERTALAQAEQYGAAISLVVSDLVLPGVSGVDLVRRLRHPCEHARVLYVSGYSPEHVGALVEGASFLRKPFTAEELVTMVRELLASSVQ
jgi:CheY-like chemotaxis protein